MRVEKRITNRVAYKDLVREKITEVRHETEVWNIQKVLWETRLTVKTVVSSCLIDKKRNAHVALATRMYRHVLFLCTWLSLASYHTIPYHTIPYISY